MPSTFRIITIGVRKAIIRRIRKEKDQLQQLGNRGRKGERQRDRRNILNERSLACSILEIIILKYQATPLGKFGLEADSTV